MKTPVIDPAGSAGVAAPAAPPTNRRWRVLLGALLLAMTPGLASAGAAGPEEWPTVPDRGPRSSTKIPWLRFSGDPTAPVLAAVPGHAMHAHEVLVVREQELSRRQRRLLRRAERHAEKATKLREKAGARGQRDTYAAVIVPVVQAAPPAPPRPIVVKREHPQVHVVHLDQEHEHEGCHGSDDESELAAEVEALEDAGEAHAHAPVVIDVEELSADVERQVERALRDVERARERAERASERSRRGAERTRGPHRSRR